MSYRREYDLDRRSAEGLASRRRSARISVPGTGAVHGGVGFGITAPVNVASQATSTSVDAAR